MSDLSDQQKRRLSSMIESLFPSDPKKGRLMENLSDGKGGFAGLSDFSDDELQEMITMERQFIG